MRDGKEKVKESSAIASGELEFPRFCVVPNVHVAGDGQTAVSVVGVHEFVKRLVMGVIRLTWRKLSGRQVDPRILPWGTSSS